MTASSGAAVDQTILPSQFHDDRANEDENASLKRDLFRLKHILRF
jgi:hypothetical protein